MRHCESPHFGIEIVDIPHIASGKIVLCADHGDICLVVLQGIVYGVVETLRREAVKARVGIGPVLAQDETFPGEHGVQLVEGGPESVETRSVPAAVEIESEYVRNLRDAAFLI